MPPLISEMLPFLMVPILLSITFCLDLPSGHTEGNKKQTDSKPLHQFIQNQKVFARDTL